MKVKLNLDAAGIARWMLEHGEKIALAIVGIVFLLFTYSAFSRETLESSKQPEELERLATTVQQHVTSSKFDQAREGVQVVDYTERAMSKPVKADHYVLARPWNPPDRDPKEKRADPEVLGAEELRIAAGFDVFSFKPDGGGDAPRANQQNAKLQPQPWAVVTGIVPLARQKQEYARVLAEAVAWDPKQDVPRYRRPILERTEVSDAPGAKEDWQKIDPPTKIEELWAGTAKDFVSPKSIDQQLTAHLATLVYNQWGERVSHPKIPREGEEPKPAAAPAAASADAKGADARSGTPAAEPTVEYLLLRVFDYTVEPGKKYRYRVTLELDNPNYGRSPLHLKTPESAAKEALTGQPTAPTGVVAIPDGHRILAGPVEAGTRYSEPTATVLVTAIDRSEGLQAALELKDARRGTVANKKQATVPVRHPGTKQVTKVTLDFESNIMVLDIEGGRTLSGRRRGPTITTPGEVLLLDAEGNMMVRSELADEKLYAESVVREASEEPAGKSRLSEPSPKAKSKGRALLHSDR